MRKRAITIIAILLVLIFVFVIVRSYFSSGSNNSGSPLPNATTSPSYTTTALINNGVTSQQLSNFEQVFNQYLSTQNKTPSTINFTSIVRQPTNPATSIPFSELDFTIQLDGKDTYRAKLDSYSLSEIRLYLYSPSNNKQLYDSQDVGASSST